MENTNGKREGQVPSPTLTTTPRKIGSHTSHIRKISTEKEAMAEVASVSATTRAAAEVQHQQHQQHQQQQHHQQQHNKNNNANVDVVITPFDLQQPRTIVRTQQLQPRRGRSSSRSSSIDPGDDRNNNGSNGTNNKRATMFRGGSKSPTPLEWKKGEQIGRGTYGEVHMALNQTTGELFCVKSIRVSLGEDAKTRISALEKEIQVMKSLEHPHIVKYLGTEKAEEAGGMTDGGGAILPPMAPPQVYIFLEYVPGGSLSRMLKQFGPFGHQIIRRYTKQILRGLGYLHRQGIIHRDVKGANVLVTETGIAKLADFGCSKQLQGAATGSMDESLRSIRGSVPWMAPEVIKQSGSGRSADVWSLGCTVIEMATAKRPWPQLTDNFSALFQVATAKTGPPYPENPSNELKLFLDRCFSLIPEERATCDQLLEMELVKDVEDPLMSPTGKKMVTKSAEF